MDAAALTMVREPPGETPITMTKITKVAAAQCNIRLNASALLVYRTTTGISVTPAEKIDMTRSLIAASGVSSPV
ncbi:hypothetical protein D3C71_1381470 [compost metagenome]